MNALMLFLVPMKSVSLCLYSDVPVARVRHPNINRETHIPLKLRLFSKPCSVSGRLCLRR